MTLETHARALRETGRKALVAFFTAGYPDEPTFVELVEAAAGAGCDAIEVGIPFSDPIADGPLIQESSTVALQGGNTLSRSLELTKQLSTRCDVPLLVMSYYNPILQMGHERFARAARSSGVQGVIIPDLPVEESGGMRPALDKEHITVVDLVAPTSSNRRIENIVGSAGGFLYLVSVTGVTGSQSPVSDDLKAFVSRVRTRTDLPLYVGFGISDAERARNAIEFADGVIIGSALIRLIKSSSAPRDAVGRVETFLRDVRMAIDSDSSGADRIKSSGGG